MNNDFRFSAAHYFRRRPPFRPLAAELARKRWKRLAPKRIKDRVAKGYALYEKGCAFRFLFRNGLHQCSNEQAWSMFGAAMRRARSGRRAPDQT